VATEMRMLARKSILAFVAVAMIFLGGSSFAGQQDSSKQVDFFEMSLEELMDVPVVVSTSRQIQRFGEPSGPISIITTEDIHYSGLTRNDFKSTVANRICVRSCRQNIRSA
jgi:hypothetical protein